MDDEHGDIYFDVPNHPTRDVHARAHAYISETLDKAGIPNVLFGTTALSLYGVGLCMTNFDYLVPDDHVDRAVSALVSAGFLACEDSACEVDANEKGKPAPGHVHIHGHPDVVLCIHKHSEIFWRVPSLNPTVTGPEADIMYASDDCLPAPWPSDWYPVRVFSVHRYFEASVLMHIRCLREQDTLVGSWDDSYALRRQQFWHNDVGLMLDTRYNVYKYQLHVELLPPSQQRYVRWSTSYSFGRSKPQISYEEAWRRLRRDSAREEAEFQASNTAGLEGAEEPGTQQGGNVDT